MKKYLSLLLLIATVCTTRAQDETVYKNLVATITTSFNKGDYTDIYNMLSADFKSNIAQKDFEGFLNHQTTLGKITGTEYKGIKDGSGYTKPLLTRVF
jgi:hypothetical protein